MRINTRLCSISVVLLMVSMQVFAGEYKLLAKPNAWMVPEDIPDLCEVYLKNLQDNRDGPAVCENVNYPQNEGFGRPVWTSIEPKEHMGLVRQVIKFKAYRYGSGLYSEELYQRKFSKKWEQMQNVIEEGRLLLDVSYFDFDNDGKKEWILKYHGRGLSCSHHSMFTRPPVGRYYYLTGEPNKWQLDEELSEDSYTLNWNISFYKGHTLLESWRGDFERGRAIAEVYYPHAVGYEGMDYRGTAKHHFCTYEYLR